MAARNNGSSRSVADATRFTSSTPHASTKSAGPRSTGQASAQPQQKPSTVKTGAAIPQETLDERVRRLRAAHLAAKQHSVSRMDRIIGNSRRFFDAAHQFTVMGLIGFSGIALLVTVYAAGDMMFHNRKRRNEFFALQKQMQEDSLESARLAYMAGTASEEQIALVEDATAKASQAGISLPSLLSHPAPAAPAGGRDAAATTPAPIVEDEPEQKKGGISAWLFRGLKKEDTIVSPADGTNAPATSVSNTVVDTAKKAYEQERANQRTLDDANASKKKGWFW